jgi:uncharacterized repeat protein (TIGR03803 family)
MHDESIQKERALARPDGLILFLVAAFACSLPATSLAENYTYSNIVNFTNLGSGRDGNGAYPYAGLTIDSQGNLFGATTNGVNGYGTLYEISAGSHSFTNLYSALDSTKPAAGPNSTLIFDANGNMYGTTTNSLFELAAGNQTPTTLATLAAPDLYAGLTIDSHGNLFGTTTYTSGSSGNGTVFELVAGASSVTTLATFASPMGGPGGSQPYAGVVMDANGNLYGTTRFGGAYGQGTIYELAAGSGTITTLFSFNTTNGGQPDTGGLYIDAKGNLFGTTVYGGASNLGTVYELAAGSSTITTIASFNGTNGSLPRGTLTFDAQGRLYGTTASGGTGGDGTVFEIDPGIGTINTLFSFSGANGSTPFAGVTLDSQGNIYGTTVDGGPGNWGTVFELSPAIVPEPASLLALCQALVLAGLIAIGKRRFMATWQTPSRTTIA